MPWMYIVQSIDGNFQINRGSISPGMREQGWSSRGKEVVKYWTKTCLNRRETVGRVHRFLRKRNNIVLFHVSSKECIVETEVKGMIIISCITRKLHK